MIGNLLYCARDRAQNLKIYPVFLPATLHLPSASRFYQSGVVDHM